MRAQLNVVYATTLAAAAAIPALAACGIDTGTGALSVGPDTYTMSKRYTSVGANAAAAERETVTDATQYCARAGRQFVQLSKDPTANANPYGPDYFTLTFQCVASSDTSDQQQPLPIQPPGQ